MKFTPNRKEANMAASTTKASKETKAQRQARLSNAAKKAWETRRKNLSPEQITEIYRAAGIKASETRKANLAKVGKASKS